LDHNGLIPGVRSARAQKGAVGAEVTVFWYLLRANSPRTEQAYVYWIRRFVMHHGRRHPRDLGPNDVRDSLSHLATVAHVAAATQNQALAALSFLYAVVLNEPLERVVGSTPARRSRRVPVVLSQRVARASR
jgi:hypothetical protein